MSSCTPAAPHASNAHCLLTQMQTQMQTQPALPKVTPTFTPRLAQTQQEEQHGAMATAALFTVCCASPSV